MTQYFVYIIECENGALYTGFTTDVERRYAEHVAGSAKCKYTRSFPPKRLAAYWAFEHRSQALSMEAKIKRMSVAEKKALIGATQY